MEAESRMVVARGWGEEKKMELLFNGHKVLVMQDEKVLLEIYYIT